MHLFIADDSHTFAVLDGAAIPELLEKIHTFEPKSECLYMGELEPDMMEVAPYLVQLEPDSDFANWIITAGWGNHWGIFAQTPADFPVLRQHFRRFLVVYNAEGRPLMFRYYDPRVLRAHLPKCKPDELTALFGPVTSYVVEDEDPNVARRFSVDAGALKNERLSLEQKR
jgi:uncharacterized protein DUF4123